MGVATRLYVAHPQEGWKRLAWNAGYLAQYAGLPLPEFANQTIVVAFAHVEVDRWRVLRLLRLERARWRFDHAGTIDQGFLREEERRRFWPNTIEEMIENDELCAADIQHIEQLLNIRVS